MNPCTYGPAIIDVHKIVEHANQEGDTCALPGTFGPMAESVYGGGIPSISIDHWSP